MGPDFVDEGLVDTKLVLSPRPLTGAERAGIVAFFVAYALAKRGLARLRGRKGEVRFRGIREVA